MNEICLLSDAFPPIIDGVVNVVTNYGRILAKDGYRVCAAVPEYAGADDSVYSYPVIRYPSLDFRKTIGYTVGNPFDIPTLHDISRRKISVLHSHCPFSSMYLGRSLRAKLNAPLILTYHTKYDLDIANAVKMKLLQDGAIYALVENVNACDELWTVSRGAGESIQSLGYEGDFVVMQNGVDLPKKRTDEKTVQAVTGGLGLPAGIPVFLFVGRLMWYKGIRIILDAVSVLKAHGEDFRMVFVGSGTDEKEIREYAEANRLLDKVLFAGSVRDRESLAAWYTRADLFVFPSTFDTNGLVVREAAACSLGSVLVQGSCAAEDVTENVNAFLIEENAESLAACLIKAMAHPESMKRIGENASGDLYLSWDDAVKNAEERYQIVNDLYRSGKLPQTQKHGRGIFALSKELLDTYDKAEAFLRRLR